MDTSLPAPPPQPPLTDPAPTQSSGVIAPWWHTALLILFLLGFSFLGSSGHPGLNHSLRIGFYISTMVTEWLVVLYIWWGLRRGKNSNITKLIGGRWAKPEDFLLDIATAIGFWIVAIMVLGGIGHLLGLDKLAHIKDMQNRVGSILPQGKEESTLWLLLCVTAGFCEEVIFRGYFQSQFAALSKSVWVGILLQGILFGASHAYEGQAMIIIGVYGMLFGVLAHWRKTLRPGMIAHFGHDAFQGLLAQRILEHALKALPKS